MAKYTTEVRSICENYAGLLESAGYGEVGVIIESARSKVFDFNYPIFDEKYKGVLETKILKHFYTREIGAETVGLWKLWLNTRMNEIMPYYNKLYKSELLEFNPLYDVDITKEQQVTKSGTKEDTGETTGTSKDNREVTGSKTDSRELTGNKTDTRTENRDTTGTESGTGTVSSTETSESSNNENNYFLDTPQGRVDDLENSDYLTNLRQIKNSGNNSTTNNGTSENSNTYNVGVEGEVKTVDNYTEDSSSNGSYTEEVVNTGETSGTSKVSSVINNTETYLETVKGKQGGESYSKKLEDYRATFLNIDLQVINELNDLFMNLW